MEDDPLETRLSFSISRSSWTKSATDSSAVPSDEGGLSLPFFFNVEWLIRGILLDPLGLRMLLATDLTDEELDRLLVAYDDVTVLFRAGAFSSARFFEIRDGDSDGVRLVFHVLLSSGGTTLLSDSTWTGGLTSSSVTSSSTIGGGSSSNESTSDTLSTFSFMAGSAIAMKLFYLD